MSDAFSTKIASFRKELSKSQRNHFDSIMAEVCGHSEDLLDCAEEARNNPYEIDNVIDGLDFLYMRIKRGVSMNYNNVPDFDSSHEDD